MFTNEYAEQVETPVVPVVPAAFTALLEALDAEQPVGATNQVERRWRNVTAKAEEAQALFLAYCTE